MKKISIEQVYELQKLCKPLYNNIHLKNVFKKYPQRIKGARFAFLCPGAIKTVMYLQSNSNKIDKKLLDNILLLTNFLFFIEIYVIYKDYINEKVYNKIKSILKNNSCEISITITNEITILFEKLSKKIKNNLPDNFYHNRHNTLICSNSKIVKNASILLLKSIYGTAESFENKDNTSKCLGKRNGVSGCRNCCKNKYNSGKYISCVDSCMDF